MVLRGVLALSLDSGMLLACSKRVSLQGTSLDVEAAIRPLEQARVAGTAAPGSASERDQDARTLPDDILYELLGIAPPVASSDNLSMPVMRESAGLPSSKANASASIDNYGTNELNSEDSFEPMQFAASLFAIYKNALEISNEDASHKPICNPNENGRAVVRIPAIRFIKQGTQIWHFIDMQLDLSTAMRGRRWTDGAVNVLVLVSLHAHLSDQVIRAVLDGVTEGTVLHLTSDRSPSSAFDKRIHEAIGKSIGFFINRCLSSSSSGPVQEPTSADVVIMSARDFDTMMKIAEDRGGELKSSLTDEANRLGEGILPPILGPPSGDEETPSRPLHPLPFNTTTPCDPEEAGWSSIRSAEEARTPTKAQRTREVPSSAPAPHTKKWQSFRSMISTKSMKSLVMGNIFPDDSTQAEESVGSRVMSSIPPIGTSSRPKSASWKCSTIHRGSVNGSEEKLIEKVALFGHFVLAEGFEKTYNLWFRPDPCGVRSDKQIALHQFAIGNAVGMYAVWAHTAKVHVVCLCRAKADAISGFVWEDILAILEWWQLN